MASVGPTLGGICWPQVFRWDPRFFGTCRIAVGVSPPAAGRAAGPKGPSVGPPVRVLAPPNRPPADPRGGKCTELGQVNRARLKGPHPQTFVELMGKVFGFVLF